MDSSSDGIVVTKALLGQRLINHHYPGCSLVILISKEPTLAQGNAHRFQISRLDYIEQSHVHVAVTLRFWLTVNPKEKIVLALHRRCPICKRDGADIG